MTKVVLRRLPRRFVTVTLILGLCGSWLTRSVAAQGEHTTWRHETTNKKIKDRKHFLKAIEQAKSLLNDGKYRKANKQLDAWSKQLTIRDYKFVNSYVSGRRLYQERRFQQSASWLSYLKDSNDLLRVRDTLFYLGMSYYKMSLTGRRGEQDKATRYLTKFLNLNPQSADLMSEAQRVLDSLNGKEIERVESPPTMIVVAPPAALVTAPPPPAPVATPRAPPPPPAPAPPPPVIKAQAPLPQPKEPTPTPRQTVDHMPILATKVEAQGPPPADRRVGARQIDPVTRDASPERISLPPPEPPPRQLAVPPRRAGGSSGSSAVYVNDSGEVEHVETTLDQPPQAAAPPRKSVKVKVETLPGSVMLLHFWASWCGPCVKDLPSFIGFLHSKKFAALKREGVEAVLITVDEFFSTGESFLKARGWNYSEQYHDPGYELLKELTGTVQIPVTVVLKRDDREILGAVETGDWDSEKTLDELHAALDRR